ncbi:hypothetical protein BDV95DRAFT_317578 [Massariosphaeria phaeospora]|uniref:Secreted protein n=1 Tax=Massariosphaeria phaeospora TaxID=100035 RepID=A0A7C8I9E0_9PLEO|nr:hypothetical protein BDV95DRAFT_317578 [Massariosphaeria phaeospora]
MKRGLCFVLVFFAFYDVWTSCTLENFSSCRRIFFSTRVPLLSYIASTTSGPQSPPFQWRLGIVSRVVRVQPHD